jgi:hypothetical protein
MHPAKVDHLCRLAAIHEHRACRESGIHLLAYHQAGFRVDVDCSGGNAPTMDIDYLIAFDSQHEGRVPRVMEHLAVS